MAGISARRRAGGEAGPFLKWAGGKSRLVPKFEALNLIPRSFAAYHEPFVGAGALFFHLAERGAMRAAYLGDANPDLIHAYATVRDRVGPLLARLEALRAAHDTEAFYAARDRYNRRAGLDGVERAALFIYLNKTGYNGLYRVNSKGEFNVPVGRYVDPAVYHEEALRAASRALRLARLEAEDFAAVGKRARPGDFVYLDPPYDPLSRTARFTSYTDRGFGDAEQERLAELFERLAGAGVAVLLSNHDTPLVRRLYRAHARTTFRLEVSRMINSNAGRRGDAVAEVAIYAGPGA